MEAKKGHDLPSASWRSRKAGGGLVIQPKAEAWELGRSGELSESESLRTRSTGIWGEKMVILAPAERVESPFLYIFLFYLDPQQIGRCPPTLGRVICSTYQFTSSNAISSWNSISGPGIIVYKLSGHPVAQSSWHIKLTITVTLPILSPLSSPEPRSQARPFLFMPMQKVGDVWRYHWSGEEMWSWVLTKVVRGGQRSGEIQRGISW